MAERIIEIYADTLEEAREQLKSQIPDGLHLLSEKIIWGGEPAVSKWSGLTVEDAFAKAHRPYMIPEYAKILEETVVRHPKTEFVTIEAAGEDDAKQEVARRWQYSDQIVKGIRSVSAGSKGFLGWGKRPCRYEVEVFEEAIVQITHTLKARISATIGIKETPEERQMRVLAELPGKAIDIGSGWEGLPWDKDPRTISSSAEFIKVVPGTYVVDRVEYISGQPFVYIVLGTTKYKVHGDDLYYEYFL